MEKTRVLKSIQTGKSTSVITTEENIEKTDKDVGTKEITENIYVHQFIFVILFLIDLVMVTKWNGQSRLPNSLLIIVFTIRFRKQLVFVLSWLGFGFAWFWGMLC